MTDANPSVAEPVPGMLSKVERGVIKVMLAAVGIVIGYVAGLVIAYSTGLIQFLC
jgi:hypothetical protein